MDMKTRHHLLLLVVAAALAACGNRMSPEQLAHKLDSVKMVEQNEHLALQGIRLEDENPLQAFFDSLSVQPLPLRYSEEYVHLLPHFQPVPPDIARFLQLGVTDDVRAVQLPETLSCRLIIVAKVSQDGSRTLWLYSIDSEFLPVDRLLIYAPATVDDLIEQKVSEFSITSDYEIRLREMKGTDRHPSQQIYHVSPARQFLRQ